MGAKRVDPASERAPVIMRRLKKAYPEATVALVASNPLEMLVATILSAQCTDQRVNMVTATLFKKYRTPLDYLKVPESRLKEDIRSTGFFNQKTRSIRGACAMIEEDFGGEVPGTMAELVRLPGVARKTANVVLGNSFGVVVGIAVDTHVGRLANRLGFSAQKDPNKVEQDLMALFPKKNWLATTYLLIDHGRAVCQAKKPMCGECVVSDLCPSSQV